MDEHFFIDPDIRRACSLPGAFYQDAAIYARMATELFVPSWQYVPEQSPTLPESVLPFELLPGCLDEPLLYSRDADGKLYCLSNVCTHRGMLVAETAAACRQLRCRYHGRRFGLDGRFQHMPQFQDVENFPSTSDDLPQVALHQAGPLNFVSLNPAQAFDDWFRPLQAHLPDYDWQALRHVPEWDKRYTLEAHWALYCENYLEGFHIPFVHPALNAQLSYPDYRYELFPRASLQVGVAKSAERGVNETKIADDECLTVAAYYFFLYPNLMLNVYPWGLSLNLVIPKGPSRTEVLFQTFVPEGQERPEAERLGIHQTEMEDEAVVEAVQRGLRAKLYKRGRFSPQMEQALHHFQRLLVQDLALSAFS